MFNNIYIYNDKVSDYLIIMGGEGEEDLLTCQVEEFTPFNITPTRIRKSNWVEHLILVKFSDLIPRDTGL